MSASVTLRVADRVTVNEHGQIVEQQSRFDTRDVTNPGWQTGRAWVSRCLSTQATAAPSGLSSTSCNRSRATSLLR